MAVQPTLWQDRCATLSGAPCEVSMSTEQYRQDLANGLSPGEAEDAEAERLAFEQLERDSQPAPLEPVRPSGFIGNNMLLKVTRFLQKDGVR